jgi:orotidine-5'-phosphate decarboxylase
MTFIDRLRSAGRDNGSMLCVGLDPEPTRFPGALQGDSARIYDFCARIVDATADLVIAFKPQIAYFASHRAEDQLERLMEHMRRNAPHVPIILDAKRGDIGSTAQQYAREAFERYGADAVTLSPFMGFDSVEPYLKSPDKGAFLLCRTSNPGGDDLQNQRLASVEGQPLLYEHIARLAQGPWNLNGQLGLVVGATYPAEIDRVRRPGRRRCRHGEGRLAPRCADRRQFVARHPVRIERRRLRRCGAARGAAHARPARSRQALSGLSA